MNTKCPLLSLCVLFFQSLPSWLGEKCYHIQKLQKNREVSNFPKRFSLIYLFLTVYYGNMRETYRIKTVVEFQPYWSTLKMELPLQQLPHNHTPAPLSWGHWKPGSHFQGSRSANYFSWVWQAPVPSAGCQQALIPGTSFCESFVLSLWRPRPWWLPQSTYCSCSEEHLIICHCRK